MNQHSLVSYQSVPIIHAFNSCHPAILKKQLILEFGSARVKQPVVDHSRPDCATTASLETFLNSFFLMLSQIIVAQQCSGAAGLKPICTPPASATSSLLTNALV